MEEGKAEEDKEGKDEAELDDEDEDEEFPEEPPKKAIEKFKSVPGDDIDIQFIEALNKFKIYETSIKV